MRRYVLPEAALRQQAMRDGITHLSTGLAVVRGKNVLVVRRAADDFLGGNYELPGGGIEAGETFAAAITREIMEETGLRVLAIFGMFPGFDYSTPKKPRVRQYNFLVTVADGPVRLSEEHDDFRWIGSDEDVQDLAVSGPMGACMKDALNKAADAPKHAGTIHESD